jgi:Protein of unknown function (DUF4235)
MIDHLGDHAAEIGGDGAPVPLTGGRMAMPGKGADFSSKAMNTLAATAAAFVARKAISFAWTKATGRPPPDAAEDPQVAIGEAVAWALVVGAGVGVARVLAIRLASRQGSRQLTGPADTDA